MEWGNGLLSFRLVLLFCFHVFWKARKGLNNLITGWTAVHGERAPGTDRNRMRRRNGTFALSICFSRR